MGLTYYDEYRKPQTKIANGLIVWNGMLTFVMVFYWSGMAAVLAEPTRWALRNGISGNPAWLEYPYVVLWLVPMLCMFGGWLALKGQLWGIARILGLYPTLTLALMVGWYNLTPPHWH